MSARTDKALRVILALVVAGAGLSEAIGAVPVVRSLEVLGYPRYLLPALAATKLSAAVALLVPVPRWLRDWAYAGLVFDFALASYSFVRVGELLLPDVVLAPSYLVLALASFLSSMRHRSSDDAVRSDPTVHRRGEHP